MQQKIEKFKNFMTKLEGAVATDAEREVVRASSKAFDVLVESFGLDRPSTDWMTAPRQFGGMTRSQTYAKPAGTATPKAEVSAPAPEEVRKANEVIQAWAATADIGSVQRWIERMQTQVERRASTQFGHMDDPQAALRDAASGKMDADVDAIKKQLAQNPEQKASLLDRFKGLFNRKKKEVQEAIAANDLMKLAKLESEIRNATAFMEAVGMDVSAIVY